MMGFVRFTVVFQLGILVKDFNKNLYCQLQKEVVFNGMACRLFFRQMVDIVFVGFRLSVFLLSFYLNRIFYKFGEVYRRIFGRELDDFYSVELDCVILMRVVKYRFLDFIQWVDEYVVLLFFIGFY